MDKLVGKKILELKSNPEKDMIQFVTDNGTFTYIAEADCCSTSWFEHLDNVSALINATVSEVDDVLGPLVETRVQYDPEDEDAGWFTEDVTKTYFLKFTTDKGLATLEMRNESNGYYGATFTLFDEENCYWFNDKTLAEVNVPLLEDF